jgi:hypothetical protein
MKSVQRLLVALLSTCLLAVTTPVAAQAAAPALIPTDAALRTDLNDRVAALLARDDVRTALAERGVAPAEVAGRVAALTDEEARLLADRLDQLPAGASDILGLLFTVFIILLITDILGLTKVFPFTRPIR